MDNFETSRSRLPPRYDSKNFHEHRTKKMFEKGKKSQKWPRQPLRRSDSRTVHPSTPSPRRGIWDAREAVGGGAFIVWESLFRRLRL